MTWVRSIAMPVRFKRFHRQFRHRVFRLLDVGCGNHSPSLTRRWFPQVEYHGVDNAVYNNDETDLAAMSRFFQIDLAAESERLDEIPDRAYDVVLFTHVIEHLHNGSEVLGRLADKVKPGGRLYVETPSERSLRLPSMPGTLNFRDDPTHVRVYPLAELRGVLEAHGLEVIAAGTRRDWPRLLLLPVKAGADLARFGRVQGSAFWDLLGFANYVYAGRPQA